MIEPRDQSLYFRNLYSSLQSKVIREYIGVKTPHTSRADIPGTTFMPLSPTPKRQLVDDFAGPYPRAAASTAQPVPEFTQGPGAEEQRESRPCLTEGSEANKDFSS